MGTTASHVYRFGTFCLDATERFLYRDGELVSLPPKAIDTLLLLVANSGQVLAKQEMMKRLWPDTFVEEGTLAQYIFLLRRALGTSAQWIENHPRRGYRFTGPVEESLADLGDPPAKEKAVAERRRLSRFRIMAAALALVGLVVAAGLAWNGRRERALSRFGSIAVLPLRTDSDAGHDYLADGITEALITKLASLKELRVVSYSRVRRFKNTSAEAAEIGRQLDVESVIEGTMRVAGGKMRLSVHAIDTRTANTLWADDRFEAGMGDLLNVERQLAEAVALRFKGQLAGTARGLLTRSRTSVAEAYDLALRARASLRAGETAQNLEAAERMLDRAVRLDPGFADAYAWLAFVQHRAYQNRLGGAAMLRAAISNANQALSRDPNSLIAMRALAHIQHSTGRAVEGLLMARRALETNPDDLDATAAAAEAYFRTGLYDRAIPLFEKALAGEPDSREFRTQLARIYLFLGEHKKGIEVISPLPLSQAGPFGMVLYAETGGLKKSLEVVRAVLKRYPDDLFSAYIGGSLFSAAGDIPGAKEIWTEGARNHERLLARHENPYAHTGLGWIYPKLGKREQALYHRRQLLGPDPHHPVFLFFAAEISALVGDRREALNALQAAVENGFLNLPMIDGMSRLSVGTLRSLRDDPEFLAIRTDLARRVDALRARY